jgi:serine/threonine-protein kinase
LVLLVLLAGAAGILIFGYARMSASIAASNDNQPGETKNESSPDQSPSRSPTPRSSAALVGVWRTSVVENGEAQEIKVTFLSDGNTRYLFKDARGRTATDTGTWQYSDEILFERFSSGASGKASIRWIDDNTVELTIIDNGVPSYIGLKRKYRRVT